MGGFSGGGGGGGGVPWSQIGASVGELVNTGVSWRQNDRAADAMYGENENYLAMLDRERDTQAGYFQSFYEGGLAASNKILDLYGLGSSGFTESAEYTDARKAWEAAQAQPAAGGGEQPDWRDAAKPDKTRLVGTALGLGGGSLGQFAEDRWKAGGDKQPGPLSPGRFEDSEQYRAAMDKWRTTNGGSSKGMGDFMSLLESSPDYQFAVSQGEKALQRRQSAQGSRLSPGAYTELLQLNKGQASMQLGNVLERLFRLAGGGQDAARSMAGVSDRYSDRYGGGLKDRGDIKASEYLGVAAINDRHNQRMQDIWGMGGGSGGPQPTSGNRGSTYGGGGGNSMGWGDDGSFNYGSTANNFDWYGQSGYGG